MAKKLAILFLELIFLLVLILASCSWGQVLHNLSSNKVSHGVPHGRLAASEACKQTYGFLPCTRSVIGNIFLISVYSYLIFLAAKWLTKGSEILLEINGYGVFGGLFLPVLCSLPGALIILASGLFGSKETAQSQASIGMGLLAGSTITLLTLLWGSCIVAGKCDLQNSVTTESPDTKSSVLTGSAIMTDHRTTYSARIMVISIVPFALIPLLQVLTSHSRLAILISLVVSISLLLYYCLYQIFQPWIQHRRLAYAMYKHAKPFTLWLTDNGEPDRDALQKLFENIDHDSDGFLSATELRALAFGLNFQEIDWDIEDVAQQLLEGFDTSGDSRVDVNEFIEGMSKWIEKTLSYEPEVSDSHSNRDHQQTIFSQLAAGFKYTSIPKKNKMQLLVDEKEESSEDPRRNNSKAILTLIIGTCIAAAFANPLVDAVDNFSTTTSITPFFVSFVVLPFVCSSEIMPSLILASRKKQKLASLIFSEIYREVTMSNILYLSIFLVLVYVRELTWNFSSEMIIVLLVCTVMGLFAGSRTTFPPWTSLLAYALYPLSLVLIYVLHFVLGWS